MIRAVNHKLQVETFESIGGYCTQSLGKVIIQTKEKAANN